ncbi:MAG: tetratricopeptide repeat protein [Myxococcales bacterium]|nr:tetratricopeptide repeat protein [Myxococcales bacterium]
MIRAALALAIVPLATVALATSVAAAAPPTLWQAATETADAAQARRSYDEAMLAGDDRVASAVATDITEMRSRLVTAALAAYDAAALARPDLAEPHWRAAAVVNAFYIECAPKRGALCGPSPSQRAAELAIEHWDAAERLAPLDPRLTDEVLTARALLHTKLATPAHLAAARVDYLRVLDRIRGHARVDALSSNANRRAFALGNLAETHMMLGDLDRAIETYREAQRLVPDLSRAFGLAVALDRDEQTGAAYEVLRGEGADAIDRFVDEIDRGRVFFVPAGEVSYYLGLAAEHQGDVVAALEHFEAFVASGAHPRYQPRARAHLAALKARLAQRLRGSR